jgi:hypothetical protein
LTKKKSIEKENKTRKKLKQLRIQNSKIVPGKWAQNSLEIEVVKFRSTRNED